MKVPWGYACFPLHDVCRRCYHGILIIMTMCELNLPFLVCILCERKKKMKISNVSVVAI